MNTDISFNMVETLQEENKQLKIEDEKNKEDVIKKANKYYLKRKDKEDVEKKAKKYYLKQKERLPQHILHDIYNFESTIDIK